MTQDSLELTCLKAMKLNGESDRVALYAASIIVHAHAIARREPALNDEALRIVGLTRRLYAVMPSRTAVAAMVDDFLAEAGAGPRDRQRQMQARDRLVDRVWRHFQYGANRDRT